jgi:hypothetical protein
MDFKDYVSNSLQSRSCFSVMVANFHNNVVQYYTLFYSEKLCTIRLNTYELSSEEAANMGAEGEDVLTEVVSFVCSAYHLNPTNTSTKIYSRLLKIIIANSKDMK